MTRLALLFVVFLSTLLHAEVRVQTKSKGEIKGQKVEYKTGTLNIYPEQGNKFHVKISINDVISVDQVEPSQVKLLAKYYLEGKQKLIANDKGINVLDSNYETGWGKKSAFYLIMAFVKDKKFKDAEDVLKKALVALPGKNDKEDRLLLKLAQSYLHYERGNPKFLMDDLNNLKVPESSLGKMFYYQLQGHLLEADAKPSQAVLSYYKGIMLGVKSQERVKIQGRIAAIYKKDNDPRQLPDLNKI